MNNENINDNEENFEKDEIEEKETETVDVEDIDLEAQEEEDDFVEEEEGDTFSNMDEKMVVPMYATRSMKLMSRNSLHRAKSSSETFSSVFNEVSDRTSVHYNYSHEEKTKWLNNNSITKLSFSNYFMFYVNSLLNNKQYKFKYIEYVGDLKTINEWCDKVIDFLQEEMEERKQTDSFEGDKIDFLFAKSDKLKSCFSKIDRFLKNHLLFMDLCSAPVSLFLQKYYVARNNTCGLIKHTQHDSYINYNAFCREEYRELNYYIDYQMCLDENLKGLYHDDLTYQVYNSCASSHDVFVRRVSAIHNMFGELYALSDFIKTTVELNDQLLFKLIMLLGNFFVLLGEYAWNTVFKEKYA